ncbi:hypothetical protein F2B00_21420, partial [Streptomyces parvus]
QGAKADVLQVGQSVYVRGDEKFWQNTLQGKPGTEEVVKQVQGPFPPVGREGRIPLRSRSRRQSQPGKGE